VYPKCQDWHGGSPVNPSNPSLLLNEIHGGGEESNKPFLTLNLFMKPNLIEMQRPWLRKSVPVSPRKSNAARTILLVSEDRQLHENLRSLANTLGHLVVMTKGPVGSVAILRAVRPEVVLLDLDLPRQAAWATADALLQCDDCPPLILLTGKTQQFDAETAIRAGSLVDKSEPPSRILAVVAETLKFSTVNQAERNAIQRVLIRWLKPFTWGQTDPAHRFWGINE
jgi:CheY-like chemotaxis protein